MIIAISQLVLAWMMIVGFAYETLVSRRV